MEPIFAFPLFVVFSPVPTLYCTLFAELKFVTKAKSKLSVYVSPDTVVKPCPTPESYDPPRLICKAPEVTVNVAVPEPSSISLQSDKSVDANVPFVTNSSHSFSRLSPD